MLNNKRPKIRNFTEAQTKKGPFIFVFLLQTPAQFATVATVNDLIASCYPTILKISTELALTVAPPHRVLAPRRLKITKNR